MATPPSAKEALFYFRFKFQTCSHTRYSRIDSIGLASAKTTLPGSARFGSLDKARANAFWLSHGVTKFARFGVQTMLLGLCATASEIARYAPTI